METLKYKTLLKALTLKLPQVIDKKLLPYIMQ